MSRLVPWLVVVIVAVSVKVGLEKLRPSRTPLETDLASVPENADEAPPTAGDEAEATAIPAATPASGRAAEAKTEPAAAPPRPTAATKRKAPRLPASAKPRPAQPAATGTGAKPDQPKPAAKPKPVSKPKPPAAPAVENPY